MNYSFILLIVSLAFASAIPNPDDDECISKFDEEQLNDKTTKFSVRRSVLDKVKNSMKYTPVVGHVYAGIQKLFKHDQAAAETFKKVSGSTGAVVGGVIGFATGGPVGASTMAAASYTLAGHAADAVNDVAGYSTK